MVLEISAFQYEACHRFRASASVHKLFVGGVYIYIYTVEPLLSDISTQRVDIAEPLWVWAIPLLTTTKK